MRLPVLDLADHVFSLGTRNRQRIGREDLSSLRRLSGKGCLESETYVSSRLDTG